MMPIQSVALVESVPQSSASSSRRSSGRSKISIRMFDCGPDVPKSASPIEVPSDTEDKRKGVDDYHLIHCVDHFAKVIREVRYLSKEAKEKAIQANRRVDDAQLFRLKVEDETRSHRERVKQLEFELAKVEARVLGEREAGKAWAEVAGVEAIEAFHPLKEFSNIKMDFASLSYLQGDIDLKENVRRIFFDLNLDLLKLNDEEVEKVEGRKV
ncbi:hypothetical protein COCNU_10G005460 [Cocos nucifera]|uniref:Uncharacterized protein n=1 Tax=Cocos nucifera TaxID=13894 RepID=A0A8K0IMC0_COCNU|nr:hypothetical protein COCNU_10G005460 [Cocos nucifera]